MDDFDDNLDDLLSEGDSFFDDPKVLAKKTTPKKTTKASDLFGLDTETKTTSKNEDDWLGLGKKGAEGKPVVKPVESMRIKTDKSVASNLFTELGDATTKTLKKEDTDDVSNILGLSSSESKPTTSKKSSILNDLLGETKKDEKSFSFDDILKSSSLRKKKEPPPQGQVHGTSVLEPKTVSKNEFVPSIARDSRRGRRNSPALIDPLGIFESQKKDESLTLNDNKILPKEGPKKPIIPPSKSLSEEKKTEEVQSSALLPKSSELPNWLGGDNTTIKKSEQQTSTSIIEPKKLQPVVHENISKPNTATENIPDHMLESLMTQQKISSSHIELQNASLALQQQESQLMIAVQLKKYEDTLAEMQRKQQEIMLKQDVQFNSLLERQFAKQQVMENNMRLQQERINNHIQLLLNQPNTSLPEMTAADKAKKDQIQTVFEENRKFYDDIVNSLKQKHIEEVFLLEESYKKQLTFLENSLESTETRLKSEIDSVNKHYLEKLENVTKDKEILVSQYEEKIKKLQQENLTEMETIKENCKSTVEDVRHEYRQMLEDIAKNNAKTIENTVQVDDISKKIDESVEMLHYSSQNINKLQMNLLEERDLITDIKKGNLSVKEVEIKAMQTCLEKQRAASDGERAQLLALVHSLETRVAEQIQGTREERWALQQATATVSARSSALDREAEFVRRNLEREREEVKTLRETLLSEHESIILKLTEEKLAISAEKTRLATSAKLANNFDTAKAKSEIESALRVAKEATELTDKERELLCKQQCEVELLKRGLQGRETKLSIKEQEMEKLLKVAEQKYRDGEQALTEAKLTEHTYNERLKDIQRQLVSLAGREKKLTEEKIALSKERLTIHTHLKDSQKCGLCQADSFNFSTELKAQQNILEQIQLPTWGSDAEILRLKYDLENENVVSREGSLAQQNDSES